MVEERMIPITFGRTENEITVLYCELGFVLKNITKLSVDEAKCLQLVLDYQIREVEKEQAKKYRNTISQSGGK